MTHYKDYPKTLLTQRNLKATSIRIDLLRLIRDYQTAMPFSEIQKELKGSDRITLYRTIQTLLEKGILHKAFESNEDTYYALCGNKCSVQAHFHDHVHFKCTVCQSVSCERLSEQVSIHLPGFTIEKVQLNLTGVCGRCG